MYLQEHSRIELLFCQRSLYLDHGDLNHICGGTLNRHIDRIALGGSADGAVSRIDVVQVATAASDGFDVAILFGTFLHTTHVARNTWKLSKVAVDDFLSLGARNGA